jgi:hypothetical protein
MLWLAVAKDLLALAIKMFYRNSLTISKVAKA